MERYFSDFLIELYGGSICKKNTAYAVPHDLGEPNGEPYIDANAYIMHDISKWRDLNLKFVVSVYRDYVVTSERDETRAYAEFLFRKAWPICQKVVYSST